MIPHVTFTIIPKRADRSMNWRLFIAAAILVAGLLVKFGAPLEFVALGVGAAALLTWWRHKRRNA